MNESCWRMLRQMQLEMGALKGGDTLELKNDAYELIAQGRLLIESRRVPLPKITPVSFSNEEKQTLYEQVADELKYGLINGSIREHIIARQALELNRRRNSIPCFADTMTTFQLQKAREIWMQHCRKWILDLTILKHKKLCNQISLSVQQKSSSSICDFSLNEIPLRHKSQYYPNFQRPGIRANSPTAASRFYENHTLRPLRRLRYLKKNLHSESSLFSNNNSTVISYPENIHALQCDQAH
eukprot:CAMPEP_0197322226 /NCGR_PEP_ID=MMETSP0891-20130614/68831_1 /TAXON_ID=44058 ORGANISM="Aureoumbra lagunensis, Strain CCMP1510" /NCGR_SAMPLE_ID=MMETSP0891 /ASSEMBLY_ACC=CAM_ASM_000534 /LENGTH=240 /DNA_ID=CAMNT_0042814511 /DNA_START=1 /DNA_END=723 /DNA_ORIENTATION=+